MIVRLNMTDIDRTRSFVDSRRHSRFKLNVEISVYSRTSGLIRGYTIDISESGVCAMFRSEVPVEEMVQLEFALPLGSVGVYGIVRHRNAFRYGLEFVEAQGAPELEVVRRTCRDLAVSRF
jgi:hypothetical protein